MEAPEKIYIPTILAANVVRFKEEGSIEYTRTDAFMENACRYLEEIFSEYENLTDYNPMKDFKQFMEESIQSEER